ncbi:MAG: ribosomal RNA processing protein [Chaenotheca gracillima]|nr:MAG: ribosomal RNA processing protein [Chaenotheca gracillima]
MARRRQKKRTHAGAIKNGVSSAKTAPTSNNPKSMVIRMGAGEVGPSISQLAKDVRAMMEPDTASRLKERKSNKLKDYTTMAGPLGVSHLLLFSRSTSGNTNMRLALTPRGPTMHFRVEKYSLCKDVRRALRHPKGGRLDYRTAPLLVMNNFATNQASESTSKNPIPKQLEALTTSVFQSLFPAISPQTTPLSSIRRVLLLNREPAQTSAQTDSAAGTAEAGENDGSYILSLRHYAITTRVTGLSRPIRRLNAAEKMIRSGKNGSAAPSAKKKGGVPNLGKLDDVADYLLDPSGAAASGFTSGSESEVETDAEVEVLETNAKKVQSRQKHNQRARSGANAEGLGSRSVGVEKRAVKLVELGPRMRLRMTKVEEGVCSGKVMWHEFVKKSKDEVKAMDRVWETRNREKAERKRVQKENVEKKRKEKGGKTGEEVGKEEGEDAEMEDVDDDEEWDSDILDEDDEVADDHEEGDDDMDVDNSVK